MNTQPDLFALKERLEHLFPGKWLSEPVRHRSLLTGIAEFDNGVTRGLVRRRITEWIGPLSCGKTSVLRAIVARWCAAGMNVAYVDKLARLRASDWAFVERGNSGAIPVNMMPQAVKKHGCFWVVRNLKSDNQDRDALWATEQLIRCGAFDVVIFDAAGNFSLASRVYARLQRVLERSKTALLILKDEDVEEKAGSQSWGCHARFGFNWALPIQCLRGISGFSLILPSTECFTWKDGLSQKVEVTLRSHVSNRLFTHPQIPDRRTSKA
ncbi:MAG TPA: hypothetical protein V6C72_10675 [Chroococcales cyanobacterium]